MLSEEAIKEFKKIWKEEFREDLSDEKTKDIAEKFLLFFKLIYSANVGQKS